MRNLTSFFALALAGTASASVPTGLFGLSDDGHANYRFVSIDATTGAASTLFGFSLPGTATANQLAYIPTTGKFVFSAYVDSNNSYIIQLDPGAQVVSAPLTGVPTTYAEGLEYSPSIGGLVVSYGAANFTGKLALLDAGTYNLLDNNPLTFIADGDTLFLDGTGALNVLDTNNPSNLFQRNQISPPFPIGPITLTGVGANVFGPTDYDLAYLPNDSTLYLTQTTSLASVDQNTNALTTVGPFGAGYTIRGIAAAPVPEPTSGLLLGAGLAILARRRIQRSC